MTRAAVLHAAGTPLSVEDITLADTGPTQVRVQVRASGVCHSDLSLARGTLPYPVPVVLGHEAAGVVVDVGSDVTKVAPGDHVIIAWNQPCRTCAFCQRDESHLCDRAMADVLSQPFASAAGTALFPMQGAGAFAEETLVLERSVVKIDASIPFEAAALIGCAVATGVGAVTNTARVTPGSTVAVIGCGGVGLSSVQGARLARAASIIAIDVVPEKLELARTFGATDIVDASLRDPVQAVMELTGWRGVDYAFEVLGRSVTIRQAFDMTRRGGTAVVVGAGRADDIVSFNALELMFAARALVGCTYGSTDPDRDFPRLLDAYQRGELDLDALITHRTDLDGIEAAFARMEAGQGTRTIVTFDA